MLLEIKPLLRTETCPNDHMQAKSAWTSQLAHPDRMQVSFLTLKN